ncbi:hypothetical protein OROMI_017194 [Orobanche minor]
MSFSQTLSFSYVLSLKMSESSSYLSSLVGSLCTPESMSESSSYLSSLVGSLCTPESTTVVPETPDLAKYLVDYDDTLDFVDSLVGSEVTTVDLFDSGVYYKRKVEWSEEMDKWYLRYLRIWCPAVLQLI